MKAASHSVIMYFPNRRSYIRRKIYSREKFADDMEVWPCCLNRGMDDSGSTSGMNAHGDCKLREGECDQFYFRPKC